MSNKYSIIKRQLLRQAKKTDKYIKCMKENGYNGYFPYGDGKCLIFTNKDLKELMNKVKTLVESVEII